MLWSSRCQRDRPPLRSCLSTHLQPHPKSKPSFLPPPRCTVNRSQLDLHHALRRDFLSSLHRITCFRAYSLYPALDFLGHYHEAHQSQCLLFSPPLSPASAPRCPSYFSPVSSGRPRPRWTPTPRTRRESERCLVVGTAMMMSISFLFLPLVTVTAHLSLALFLLHSLP